MEDRSSTDTTHVFCETFSVQDTNVHHVSTIHLSCDAFGKHISVCLYMNMALMCSDAKHCKSLWGLSYFWYFIVFFLLIAFRYYSWIFTVLKVSRLVNFICYCQRQFMLLVPPSSTNKWNEKSFPVWSWLKVCEQTSRVNFHLLNTVDEKSTNKTSGRFCWTK